MLANSLQAQDFTFNKSTGKSVPNFVGELKVFRGKVFKVTDGNKKPVQSGTRFFKNDTLITEDKSFAKVIIVDDTVMNISANSEVNFADFKFIAKDDRRIVYSFIKGQVRALVKNKAEDGDIVIKTKLAVMAVRGTEFFVNHQEDQKVEFSEFALLSGSIQVTDDQQQKHKLKTPDRMIVVKNPSTQKAANEIRSLSEEELASFKADKDSFLPFFDPKNISIYSPLYPVVFAAKEATSTPGAQAPQIEAPQGENKKNWRNNLEKLNEQLRKNQQD